MASAASATITVDSSTMSYTGPTQSGADTTIGYSEAGLPNPFTEWLTLTNTPFRYLLDHARYQLGGV